MLYLLLFCAMTSIAAAKLKDQQVYRLPVELVRKAEEYTRPCIEKYNADPDVFRKVIDWTITNDEVTKNFLYCFCVKGKFSDEEGHFNVDRMASLLGDHKLKKPFIQALTNCNKITKENPVETIYAACECLDDNAPVVFSL